MKRILTRIAGIALVSAGIAGLVFAIVGLVVLARVEQNVESTVMEQVRLLDRALAATAEGLVLAEDSLAQAGEAIGALESTLVGAGQTIGDAVPMVDSLAELLGEQLPATVETTQQTLRSVATSANLVDDALAVVTSIPFLGLERYNPEVPLHLGLEEVASSLDEIPASLGMGQEGLTSASGNLEGLQAELTTMAGSIRQTAMSLEGAQSVLTQYQEVVADLQTLVASVREGLPGWLRWLRLGLSLALVWLGVAQIGLITQGWELIGRSRRASE